MKYLKMPGLAAVAAMALMAFVGAGTASAAGGRLCSTATNACTSPWPVPTTLDFSLKPGTSATFVDTQNNTLDTCTTTTIQTNVTSNPAGGPATGSNTAITWGTVGTNCTFTTDTTKLGKLKIESQGDGNGWLVVDEEIKVTINAFGSCEYGFTVGTTLGTIVEGNPSSFVANAVAQRIGTCLGPPSAKFTAEYTQTAPNTTFYVSTS